MRRTLAALVVAAGAFWLGSAVSRADDAANPVPPEAAATAAAPEASPAAPAEKAEAAAAPAPSGKPAEAEQAAAPQKYLLRYKFHAGEEMRWKVVHRSAMRASVQGETQSSESVSNSVKIWCVTSVAPDGTATLAHRVEDVDMWQKVPGRSKITYNSKTDAKAPAGFEKVARSVGVVLSVITMNSRGNILARVQKNDDAAASRGEITVPLPEHEVAVGESWSIPQTVDVPVENGTIRKIRLLQQFTLESVQTGVATIRVENMVLTPVHDPAIQAKLVQREPNGNVRFDIESGRVLSQQMDIDKHVVGFQGEASSMNYMARLNEEFLGAETKVAAGPATDETASK